MDRAPPRGAGRDAVGERWATVFAFQAALFALAFALHLASSPRRAGFPACLLLALHPLLSCASTGVLALAFLLSASPHPRTPLLPRRLLAGAILTATAPSASVPLPRGFYTRTPAGGLSRGFASVGAVFAAHCFGRGRWLLRFPLVQICRRCARTLAALTALSRREAGGSLMWLLNSPVVMLLWSPLYCLTLVAAEACLGKKTNPQPIHTLGPASIKWANFSTGKKDNVTAIPTRQRVDLHSKVYAMADFLRTSIYQVVSAFLDDMRAKAKTSSLEKNWISEGRKLLFGSHAMLVQKLCLFLEYSGV